MQLFRFYTTVFITLIGAGSIVCGMEADDAKIQQFMKLCADIDEKDENNWTPLYRAILASKPEAVKLLINLGADVQSNNGSGWLPLHGAATRDNEEIIRLLLAAGAGINSSADGFKSCTPLHIAAKYNQHNIVTLLVASGVAINSQDALGRTPLYYALFYDNRDISSLESDERIQRMLNLLISLGADVAMQDKGGKLPSDYAQSACIAQFLATIALKQLEKSMCANL